MFSIKKEKHFSNDNHFLIIYFCLGQSWEYNIRVLAARDLSFGYPILILDTLKFQTNFTLEKIGTGHHNITQNG